MKKSNPTAQASGLQAAIARLSDREKKMLAGMAAVLSLLVLIVIIGLFQRSLAQIELETTRYQQALTLLNTAGPIYAQKAARPAGDDDKLARFTDEVLANNDLKLTSFVATHAAATNITVSSYDEDQLPLGSKSKNDPGPIVIERQLRVDIREAQMDRLIEFLDRIEKADEPVVVKRVDIRSMRKGEGTVRALVVVSTFIKRDKES